MLGRFCRPSVHVRPSSIFPAPLARFFPTGHFFDIRISAFSQRPVTRRLPCRSVGETGKNLVMPKIPGNFGSDFREWAGDDKHNPKGKPKNERKLSNMKNRNNQLAATLFVVALALAPIVEAGPRLDGGPTRPPNDAPRPDGGPVSFSANPRPGANSDAIPELPVLTIHSTDNVTRGKTGSFVLNMESARVPGGMYVNFSISGTAVAGIDYVQPLSPAYVGQSGYGTILVQTLPDPRGLANRQPYSVVVTLEPGLGYVIGAPSSATMWIKP